MTQIKFFGVRGSAPAAHSSYLKFGGNTASITIRTINNSLIFLDAGSGIRFADRELDNIAERIFLLISHTHADHILNFGISKLPYLNMFEGYKDKKITIYGPKTLKKALCKYYDGELIWPVKFDPELTDSPNMPGIDYDKLFELDETTKQIDDSTSIETIKGNHPVKGGVLLYKVITNSKIIVYATDNEFDYIGQSKNKDKDLLISKYVDFIKNADILIADAQYTKDDYEMYKGYGHSYHEQIIQIAEKANVKELLMTHHHFYTDEFLAKKEIELVKANQGIKLKFQFAREGTEINL